MTARLLLETIFEHAQRHPDRPALGFFTTPSGRVDLSYAETATQTDIVSAALATVAKPGDRAVLLMPSCPEFAISFLACLATGVIAVPLPPPVDDASRRRVAGVLADCSPTVIISTSSLASLVKPKHWAGIPWLLADQILATGTSTGSGPSARVDGTDIAFLQYTSGSTKAPRGVLVSHAALAHNEAAIGDQFGVHPDSTVVSWLPLHHDMGLIGGLLQPLHACARAILVDPLEFLARPVRWLEMVSAEGADISGGPNFAYELCLRKISEAESTDLDLTRWRVAFNGAGRVHPSTIRAFTTRFAAVGFNPAAFVPCYGLAESTLLVANAPRGSGAQTAQFTRDSLEVGQPEPSSLAPGAVELITYKLPSHTRVEILEPDSGRVLGDLRTGEIAITGPSNGDGYWGGPVGTATTFESTAAGEPLRVRSGDLGFTWGEDLYIQGRAKDLIIHRGRNLYPDDIEADVSHCDRDVRPGCGVVFSIDDTGDEAVVVCQEVRTGSQERASAIVDAIRRVVTDKHSIAVRTVLLLPPRTITKTSSGKLERHRARSRYLAGELPVLLEDTRSTDQAGAGGLDTHLAGKTSAPGLELALRQYLREELGLQDLPQADAPLASIGVDSLVATQMHHGLQSALQIALPVTAALRAGSVADLVAAALAVAPSSQPCASENMPTHSHTSADLDDLTEAQRSLWFMQRLDPQRADYNVTRAFEIHGEVSVQGLEQALTWVVAQHPQLQLAVRSVAGVPQGTRTPFEVIVEQVDGTGWTQDRVRQWYADWARVPFDLAEGRLVRAALVTRPDTAILGLSLHHIVCDVASLSILVAEVAAAYAMDTTPNPALEGIAASVVEQETLARRGGELAEFWSTQLVGDLPVLTLPVAADRRSRIVGSTDQLPEAISFTMPPQTTEALLDLARTHGLTLHNLLLAAYQVVLHRLSGQDDLIVGVPSSGRGDQRLQQYVGYLVNVLPVRSCINLNMPFVAFARQTQDRMLDALDHQAFPLTRITRLVGPDRESAGDAIFQAMYSHYGSALPGGATAAAVLAGDPHARLRLGVDGDLRGYAMPDPTAQSDLGLNTVLRGDHLHAEMQVDRRRVATAQAHLVVDAFRELLDNVAAAPQTPVGLLRVLADDRARAALTAGTGPTITRHEHYLDVIERVTRTNPDAVAADDGQTQLTYAELDQRSNHVAARLRELGTSVDRNVAVTAQRSCAYLVALLGIHKADGCYVPINPAEAPQRAAGMLEATQPVAVIADASAVGLLDRVRARTPHLVSAVLDLTELTTGRRPDPIPRTAPPHAASTIIHTSGSTGLPKAAVSTNYGVGNHMWQMIEHFALGPDDWIAQTGPVSFDISVWQFLTPLLVGGGVRIVPEPMSQSPAQLLAVVEEGQVSMLELVPSAINALLDAGLAHSPGHLRVMLSTGEALTAEVLDRWVSELPHIPIHNSYGPAECTDDVTAGVCADGPDQASTTSIGVPLSNTTVHVLDQALNPVPDGVMGMLHVGWGAVGRGYRGDPRRTAQKFVPDPWSPVPGGRLYRTGDVGRRASDGSLDFLGRADTQTKVRGVRIEAGEVEGALRECTGVREAAMRAHAGPSGAVLVGYVALAEPVDVSDEQPNLAVLLPPQTEARLRTELADRLPRYMIPTLLVSLPHLPRSKNGKVDYNALHYTRPDPTTRTVDIPVEDPVAAEVCRIWSNLLHTDVGWHDGFFERGGHSLLALAMIDRVCERFDVDLPVDAVFVSPRLDQFVARVHQSLVNLPSTDPTPLVVGTGFPAPASATQERFWFLREHNPDQPTYNMPGLLHLIGQLDEDVFEHALREVLDTHSVLLARFAEGPDGLVWSPAPVTEFELVQVDLRGVVAEFGEQAFATLAEAEADEVADLGTELPFRATLARTADQQWCLLVVVDHIVCDGWSLSLFLDNLAAAYNRRLLGLAAPATADDAYGFADYCHEERARRTLDKNADLLAEWADLAPGPVSRLPVTTNGSTVDSPPRTGMITRTWTGSLSAALRGVAAQTSTTPYIVLSAAVAAQIHSGQDREESVLLGTLIAQRDQPHWRGVVGPLLGVGVIAATLRPGLGAQEVVARIRDGALRAYRASHVPFQDLARLLPPAPGGDGSPFEVLVVLQPPNEQPRFDGLDIHLQDLVPTVPAYPLVVDAEQRGGDYVLSLRYATDRLTTPYLEQFLDRLEGFVLAAADQREAR